MTTSQLRSAIRSLILATIPGAKEDRDRLRAERARREARVEIWPESSGNAAIAGRELPASEVIVADQRLTEIARKLRDAGAAGGLEELRAAIFVALLTGRDLDTLVPSSDPGELVPLSGTVNLTMPLSSWLGSADAPGEAAGYGPLAAADCRGLADRLAGGKNVKWCLTLTDPEGRAVVHGCARASPRPGSIRIWMASVKLTRLECGTCTHQRESRAYRPPEMMRHLVCIRQRTCAFPGWSPARPNAGDLTTTPSRSTRVAAPANAICPLCVAGIIRPSRHPAGSCFNRNQALWYGPHPTLVPTPPNQAYIRQADGRRAGWANPGRRSRRLGAGRTRVRAAPGTRTPAGRPAGARIASPPAV